MKSTLTEQDLVNCISYFLILEGYRIRHEVPNMGQSADIVATRGRWITVIEAKLYNWKRGLEQCRAHQHVADFVCLGIATRSLPPLLVHAVEEKNYGLLHYDTEMNRCDWIVRPSLNRKVWKPQRQIWTAKFRTISHVT